MFGGRRRRESDEWRLFMRETLLRFDRGTAARHEENRILLESIRAHQEEDRVRLEEILAEGRAGREALFKMLDRLDGNGGTSPAT